MVWTCVNDADGDQNTIMSTLDLRSTVLTKFSRIVWLDCGVSPVRLCRQRRRIWLHLPSLDNIGIERIKQHTSTNTRNLVLLSVIEGRETETERL
jgi:hypothetical protein